jgi:outer membrane protein OmpA-like peptidoglycan-associated protein
MNRNWHRRAIGGLPILSAALLSAVGLLWDGVASAAAAQTYSGASNEVIVNYDVLDALPGQAAPYGAQGGAAGTPPKSQFLPRYAPAPGAYGVTTTLPPYTPYGTMQPGVMQPAPIAPGLAAGLAAPPTGTPTSVLTTLGPDGRPITPIKLKKPGSAQSAQKPKKQYAAPVQKEQAAEATADSGAAVASEVQGTDSQIAAVTPPGEPSEVPSGVPMPEGTPPAPSPGVNAETPPAAPVVETPAPPAEAATPAAEAPAEQPAEQPAAEQPAEEQASQEQPPEAPAAEAPAEAPPAEAAEEEQPTEEAAAEPAPDNTQPAPPIPQGGIRIVFPSELNEVPSEANAALDDLAAQMLADESMRIQIMCYASGTEDTESKARRKSLARCINIRQYLFKKDVRTTRMDVRALGLKSEGQPADRVDIVPASS